MAESQYHTTQSPVMVLRLLRRTNDLAQSDFALQLAQPIDVMELGAISRQCWVTSARELKGRKTRGQPKTCSVDGVEVLTFSSLEDLQAARQAPAHVAAARQLADSRKTWLGREEEIVVQARYGGTWADPAAATSILVYAIKRSVGTTRGWMQKYWQMMHGPAVVWGFGTDRFPGKFMKAATPQCLQYQQWHALEDHSSWDGAAIMWFGDPSKHPPSVDSATAKMIDAHLLHDEGRFIDLAESDLFIVTPLEIAPKAKL